MPIFDFKCDKCRKVIEDLVKSDLSDAPKTCDCGGKYHKQIVDRFSMDFVGSGFYINDYGKHNWKKGKSADQISKILGDPKKGPY